MPVTNYAKNLFNNFWTKKKENKMTTNTNISGSPAVEIVDLLEKELVDVAIKYENNLPTLKITNVATKVEMLVKLRIDDNGNAIENFNNLDFSSLNRYDIRLLNIINCNFVNCSFKLESVQHVQICDSTFDKCTFLFRKNDNFDDGTVVEFRNDVFNNCSFSDNNFGVTSSITYTDFNNCDLNFVGFNHSSMESCNFNDCNMYSSSFSYTSLYHVSFINVDLDDSDFCHADFTRCSYTNVVPSFTSHDLMAQLLIQYAEETNNLSYTDSVHPILKAVGYVLVLKTNCWPEFLRILEKEEHELAALVHTTLQKILLDCPSKENDHIHHRSWEFNKIRISSAYQKFLMRFAPESS